MNLEGEIEHALSLVEEARNHLSEAASLVWQAERLVQNAKRELALEEQSKQRLNG